MSVNIRHIDNKGAIEADWRQSYRATVTDIAKTLPARCNLDVTNEVVAYWAPRHVRVAVRPAVGHTAIPDTALVTLPRGWTVGVINVVSANTAFVNGES